jgi:hypothetical protein
MKIYIEAQPDGNSELGKNDHAETERFALCLHGLHIYDTGSISAHVCPQCTGIRPEDDFNRQIKNMAADTACEIQAKLASRCDGGTLLKVHRYM